MLAQTTAGAGLFEPRGSIKVKKIGGEFSPATFFAENRSWIYVAPILWRTIEQAAVEQSADVVVEILDLTKSAFDREIEANLPPKHSIECSVLAALLLGQRKNGKNGGPLLDAPRENTLVYLAGLPVQVSAQRLRKERWSLADWRYDGEPWPAGTRLLYTP